MVGQVLGEAEGEGHHREGWVGAAARWEYGATGDVEITEAVDRKVGVDDAGCGIIAHAQATHSVAGIEHVGHSAAGESRVPFLRIEAEGL